MSKQVLGFLSKKVWEDHLVKLVDKCGGLADWLAGV